MQRAKVLITGVTGSGRGSRRPGARRDNEVWGIARFTDATTRDRLTEAGVRWEVVNMATGDFHSLPRDFDYVLNFAVAKTGRWDKELGANAESVGLLMVHGLTVVDWHDGLRRMAAKFHPDLVGV